MDCDLFIILQKGNERRIKCVKYAAKRLCFQYMCLYRFGVKRGEEF